MICAALLLVAVVGVALTLQRPDPPSFSPTPLAVLVRTAPDTAWRMTIDASDERRWQHVNLLTGEAVPADREWHLGFRRFNIMSNGGAGFPGRAAVAQVDPLAPETAAVQPAAYAFTSSRDSINPGFGKWYDYGFTSHLLTPKPRLYSVALGDGRAVRLRLLGYYCPGAQPGCVTFEYSRPR